MRKLPLVIPSLGVFCLSTAIALADSISPASFSASIAVGESVTVHKTVTVNEGVGTALVDVYFLADTTGSMGGYLNTVRTNAISIMTAVAGLGDVQFAVGEYKDFPISPYGGFTDFPYKLNSALTADTTVASTAMGQWVATGGNDLPESQFAALEALSGSEAGDVGWRTGSKKIVVWFGDVHGHDTENATEMTATGTGADYPGPGQSAVIASLNALGIQVEAVNSGASGNAMDFRGQASEIAAATGGNIYNNTSTTGIAAVIQDALEAAVLNYTTVGLDLSEVPAGLSAAAVPSSHVGAFDRSITRTFEFDLTFTGVAPGSYDFNVYGTVDGARVATERDLIDVGGSAVPDGGATVVLFGLALSGLALISRRKF